MNSKLSFILSTSALVLTMSGCKNSESIAFEMTPYKHNSYGELPLLPKNQTIEPGQFFPMASDSGSLQFGKTKRATLLAIGSENGKDKMCPLAENVDIVVVALVKTEGDKKYAIVQIKDPCVPKGVSAEVAEANKIFEGYLPLEDISVTGAGDTNTGDLSSVSARVIDGIKAQSIGGSAGGDPKVILAGGNAEAIKQVLKNDFINPSGGDYRGYLNGCVAVEQGTYMANTKTIQGCGGASATSKLAFCSIPGNNFRAAKTNLKLAIYGVADFWKITPHRGNAPGAGPSPVYGGLGTSNSAANNGYNLTSIMQTQTLASSEVQVHSNGISIVPIDRLLENPNTWRATQGYFEVQGVNKDGVNIGSPCLHSFTIASPIVLDLSPSQRAVRTVDQIGKKVQFDLNADGIKEDAGWVYPYMGFLARDWNGNGLIDNGSELFGEYSQNKLGGKFKHGYEALSLLDSDRNGYIDVRDPEFKNLVVWVDENMDGRSQKSEMRSLAFHKITRIDVVADSMEPQLGEFNQVLYKSKFYGPDYCGSKGCATYDIFFGTGVTQFQSAEMSFKR